MLVNSACPVYMIRCQAFVRVCAYARAQKMALLASDSFMTLSGQDEPRGHIPTLPNTPGRRISSPFRIKHESSLRLEGRKRAFKMENLSVPSPKAFLCYRTCPSWSRSPPGPAPVWVDRLYSCWFSPRQMAGGLRAPEQA